MNPVSRKGKHCAVVLERLDTEILSQYMQTYDPNPTLLNFINNVTDQSRRCKFCFNDYSTNRKHTKPRKKKKLKKTVSNSKCKRKKRKVRLFISSGDESSSESNKQRSLNTKIVFTDNQSINSPSTSLASDHEVVHDRAKAMEVTAESPNTSRVNIANYFIDKKIVEISKSKAKCKEKIFKNLLASNSCLRKRFKHKEIESKVIQEVIKLKKIIVEKERNRNITEISDVNMDVEGDDIHLREDNEDDTATVIFEDLPEADMGDTVEKETGSTDKTNVECSPTENSKNKDLKKESLINSTENLNQNSAAVSQPRESPVGRGLDEKSAWDRNIREHLLGEMCCIVKRLHELHKVIFQLQREVPRDDEFAVHFSKVIIVQRENFYNEIKRNQKVIIENYQKLLAVHDNSEYKLALEISRRTCLNIEDVNYIISQCFAFEKKEKIENINCALLEKQEKQNGYLQSKTSDDRSKPYEKSQKLVNVKKARIDDNLKSEWQPFFPSKDVNYQPRLTNNPVDVPNIHAGFPAKESTMSQTQTSSYNGPSVFLPFPDGYQVQNPNKTHFWTQQINRNQSVDPGLKQPLQQGPHLLLPGFVSLHPDPLLPNRQSSKMKTPNPHPQNTKSATSSFLLNPDCLSHQRNVNPEYLASGIPRHPLCVQPCGIPNYNVYQSLPSSLGNTNFGFSVPQNTVTYLTIQQPNNPSRGNAPFSSNIHNRMVDAPRQIQSSMAGPQCFNYFDDPVRFSSSSFTQTPHALSMSGEESQGRNRSVSMKSGPECGNPSSGATQEALDPTVPQKLTLKNCRLQAEPKLRQGPDEDVDPRSTKVFQEETKDCSRGVKNNSKARVYICARSGCKKSGVHICQGCQSVIYCSEFCQLSHWASKHKTECHQLKELKGI